MGLVIADIRFKKAHYKPGKVGTARSEQPTTVRKGFFFLGLYLQHMEIPRLGGELEL